MELEEAFFSWNLAHPLTLCLKRRGQVAEIKVVQYSACCYSLPCATSHRAFCCAGSCRWCAACNHPDWPNYWIVKVDHSFILKVFVLQVFCLWMFYCTGKDTLCWNIPLLFLWPSFQNTGPGCHKINSENPFESMDYCHCYNLYIYMTHSQNVIYEVWHKRE